MKFYGQGTAWHHTGGCYQPSLGRTTPDCRGHSWWAEVEADSEPEAWEKMEIEEEQAGYRDAIYEFASFRNPDGSWRRQR